MLSSGVFNKIIQVFLVSVLLPSFSIFFWGTIQLMLVLYLQLTTWSTQSWHCPKEYRKIKTRRNIWQSFKKKYI